MANEFRKATAERLDVEIEVSEEHASTTIERAWLDTVRPEFGGAYALQVQLQDFRGEPARRVGPSHHAAAGRRPAHAARGRRGDARRAQQRDLQPGKPTTWPDLVKQVNDTRRNNRLYMRLIAQRTGTVVGGETLPSLPGIGAVGDSHGRTVSRAAVNRTVVGAWEQRMDVGRPRLTRVDDYPATGRDDRGDTFPMYSFASASLLHAPS